MLWPRSGPKIPRRYVLASGMAIVSFGMAFLGWWFAGNEVEGKEIDRSFFDILYLSLSVYGFGDSYKVLPASGTPRFLLEVARFIGPVSVGVLAFAALFGLLREKGIRTEATKSDGGNAIIIGSSPLAFAAAGLMRPVEIIRTVHLGANTLGQEQRLFRLPWEDTSQKKTCLTSFARNAEFILVSEPDDAETLVLAVAAGRAEPKARVTALVSSCRLAEDYADLVAGDQRAASPRLRLLSIPDLAVRSLHIQYPPFLRAMQKDQARIHAVIVGFGETGEAVARDIATNCMTTRLALPRLTVVDPAIQAREAALRQRVPELDETVVFSALDGAFGCGQHPPQPLALDVEPVTHVYLCLRNDGETLAAAGAVRQWLRLSGQPEAPLFLRLRDAGLLREQGDTIAFGDQASIVDRCRWLDPAADRAAILVHEAYFRSLSPDRKAANAASTARPWDGLSPEEQRSNHAVVAHIPAKLASAKISETLWRGRLDIPRLHLEHGRLEPFDELVELEHKRWNAERRWSGWRYSGKPRREGGSKNTATRHHPDLVPFGDLSEESKTFDRKSIEVLQQLLKGE